MNELKAYDKIWSDIPADLRQSYNKDVGVVRGLSSVNNSLAGIIMTRPGSRPFMPEFGCDLGGSLFELMNPAMENTIKKKIKIAIDRFEPRIDPNKLFIEIQFDYDNNSILVNIVYALITANTTLSEWTPYTFSQKINEGNYA